ncbi:hypothetical protein [Pseudomonas sp. LP_7_YM]|uniref:hypothetical protein n=1 Tax=Pseudomonas sp. LP_7_YM TaxID=2485137 RepID=UPI0010612315|nr:hypothetical protein [Pseudomonas sp. LP_7_YM]TDV58599.1 hypothetical protein EC915_1321 [Pseudomonas sp. LP_7_YM]
MKLYNGFYELLNGLSTLPETGWIFVDSGEDIDSDAAVRNAKYYVAENEVESIEFEKKTYIC